MNDKTGQRTSNRCQNVDAVGQVCRRTMQLDEHGKEICFYCQDIAALDREIAREAVAGSKRAQLAKIQEHFNLYSVIPPKLKKANFENYAPKNKSQEKAAHDCQRFAENFNKNLEAENDVGLLLHGNYGLGKSHLAVAVAKRVMELGSEFIKPDGSKGVSVVFVNLPELVTKIKGTWRKDSAVSEAQMLEMLKTCDLLIIDELGGKMNRQDDDGQSWLNDILYQITDARQGRNTIYTSNPAPGDLLRHVNGKIYERIFYNLHELAFEGKSHRIGGEF